MFGDSAGNSKMRLLIDVGTGDLYLSEHYKNLYKL